MALECGAASMVEGKKYVLYGLGSEKCYIIRRWWMDFVNREGEDGKKQGSVNLIDVGILQGKKHVFLRALLNIASASSFARIIEVVIYTHLNCDNREQVV